MSLVKFAVIFAIILTAGSFSVRAQTAPPPSPAPEVKFDPELAQRLGADEYGMRQYVFAILKRGTAKIDNAKARESLMAGHLKNIGRLANEGKLVLAGPFLIEGEMQGIFIFNVSTVDEARKLVETDPAIKAGIFAVELYPWYGSAALVELGTIHKRIQKKSITD